MHTIRIITPVHLIFHVGGLSHLVVITTDSPYGNRLDMV